MIYGEDREATGTLLSIDDREGVVQLDGNHNKDIKLIQLKFLCKMKDSTI